MEKKEMKGGVFNECLLMNIFPTGCPHGQGGRGSAKCRQLQTGGRGGQKSLKMCGHPLWMAPKTLKHLSQINPKLKNTFQDRGITAYTQQKEEFQRSNRKQ